MGSKYPTFGEVMAQVIRDQERKRIYRWADPEEFNAPKPPPPALNARQTGHAREVLKRRGRV